MRTAFITVLLGLAAVWAVGLVLFPATWVGLASAVYGTVVTGAGFVYDLRLKLTKQRTVTDWVCERRWRVVAFVAAAFVAWPLGFLIHFTF